jgi:AraC-like DNA-binding protein
MALPAPVPAPVPRGLRISLLNSAFDRPRETGLHAHAQGQLFALHTGLLVMETPAGRWAQLPGRIGWMPPREAHGARSFGPTSGWSLYLDEALSARLPPRPQMLALTPLAARVLERLTAATPAALRSARHRRLVQVLLDELAEAGPQSLHLPMPQDARLARVAAQVLQALASPASLDDCAARAGMARSSFVRHFRAETGLAFGQWRQQARLLRALELLSDGASVTATALSVGYDSVSAFIESFRKSFGTTPSRFFSVGASVAP